VSRRPNTPIFRLRFRLERRGGPNSVYRRWQLVVGSVAATVALLLIMALMLTSLFVLMLVTIALVIAGVLLWSMLYAAPRLVLTAARRRLGSHKPATEVRPDLGEGMTDDSIHIE
jgi:uncharacterized membrane protein